MATWRYYIVPYENLAPKYISGEVPIVRFWIDPHGREGHCLAAVEAEDSSHATLASKTDVDQFPVDLTATLTVAQRDAVRTQLSNRNLPSDWVTTSLTWKQVLRGLAMMATFFRRVLNKGLKQKLIGSGVTLSTTFSELPLGVQEKLNDAALSFGFQQIPSDMTVEQMLLRVMSDFGNRKFRLGPEVL